MFVIWPKYVTLATSRDSKMTSFFVLPIAHVNILALTRAHFYNFLRRPLPVFVIWPKYANSAISGDSKTATFFARRITLANIPTHPGALLL